MLIIESFHIFSLTQFNCNIKVTISVKSGVCHIKTDVRGKGGGDYSEKTACRLKSGSIVGRRVPHLFHFKGRE